MNLLDDPDVENNKYTGESISIGQQCKILNSTEWNYQLKDEGEILLQDGIEPEPQIKWETPISTLSIDSSETPDNGTNSPRMADDYTQFYADKGGLPLLFVPNSLLGALT